MLFIYDIYFLFIYLFVFFINTHNSYIILDIIKEFVCGFSKYVRLFLSVLIPLRCRHGSTVIFFKTLMERCGIKMPRDPRNSGAKGVQPLSWIIIQRSIMCCLFSLQRWMTS